MRAMCIGLMYPGEAKVILFSLSLSLSSFSLLIYSLLFFNLLFSYVSYSLCSSER